MEKNKMFIEGEKIFLRAIEEDDLNGNWINWLNNRRVTQYMNHGVFPYNAQKLHEYYSKVIKSDTDIVLAIVMKENEAHVGNIGVHNINYINKIGTVGIIIGEENAWGMGVGTEAIILLSHHLIKNLNLNRLHASTSSDNAGCIKAFEKAGYIKEGVLRQTYYYNGNYHDEVVFSLIRKDLSIQNFEDNNL